MSFIERALQVETQRNVIFQRAWTMAKKSDAQGLVPEGMTPFEYAKDIQEFYLHQIDHIVFAGEMGWEDAAAQAIDTMDNLIDDGADDE